MAEYVQKIPPILRIQRGRGLIEKQKLRREGKYPGNRRELFLTAREAVYRGLCLSFEFYKRECFLGARCDLFRRIAVALCGKGHIRADRRHKELVLRVLKHIADSSSDFRQCLFFKRKPAEGNGGRLCLGR